MSLRRTLNKKIIETLRALGGGERLGTAGRRRLQGGRSQAGGAILSGFRIQPFHVMGRSHDAAPVEAMAETQYVAQLVDGFLH